MDVFVGQFAYFRVLANKIYKAFFVGVALVDGADLLGQFRDTSRQRLFFIIITRSQKGKLLVGELTEQ